ncbi:hypothetical protein HNP99_003292 [Flavobacterium sp. 28A]|uniref:hypothetical protein n=1 Tax=Flavobacterium sp. 28A TaxID=2735895 RepID=UPI00156E2D99|nr:hypothetical protein [Flavobacterium sp. 28A]NRT16918.1 hypothetical protein [Flavobacterium sp. 28A]
MDNQDKIFDKIRTASQKAETRDFPGIEKVWARVDEKLDKKALKTKNKLWKKIAIAASVLLLISVAYQVIKPTNEIQIIKNEIVTADTIIKKIAKPDAPVITHTTIDTVKINNVLKSTRIVSNQVNAPQKTEAIVMEETAIPEPIQRSIEKKSYNKETLKKQSSQFHKGAVYDAILVSHAPGNNETVVQADAVSSQAIQANAAPLVVVDGQALSSKKSKALGNTGIEIASNLKNNDIESVLILKEPLYIINGVEYSEEDLFGANPTSPYAPLNKQEIQSIEILQNDEAITKYGDKGKKGVVIITTKNRKPVGK